ncbi:MAG: MaoC family dehydratase [Candidatus Dormiibacterota bacterium]
MRYFEDFGAGDRWTFGPVEMSADRIIAFAREWDPQRFHVSEEGGRDSIYGGLIASGLHTMSEVIRLYVEGLLLDTACQGSPGFRNCQFLLPVRPGDSLSAELLVRDTAVRAQQPDRGYLSAVVTASNQRSEPVFHLETTLLIACRGASAREVG